MQSVTVSEQGLLLERGDNLAGGCGVQAGSGFVCKEQGWPGHQLHPNVDPLALPSAACQTESDSDSCRACQNACCCILHAAPDIAVSKR